MRGGKPIYLQDSGVPWKWVKQADFERDWGAGWYASSKAGCQHSALTHWAMRERRRLCTCRVLLNLQICHEKLKNFRDGNHFFQAYIFIFFLHFIFYFIYPPLLLSLPPPVGNHFNEKKNTSGRTNKAHFWGGGGGSWNVAHWLVVCNMWDRWSLRFFEF